MMRYNPRRTVLVSFGLMAAGVVLILLRGLLSLVPDAAHLLPAWVALRTLNGVVNLGIGLSTATAILLFFWLVLMGMARLETDALETRGDIQGVKAQIELILERERARYGDDTPPLGIAAFAPEAPR